MHATVEIRRSDLVLLSLWLLPRAKSNWVAVAVIACCVFVYLAIATEPRTGLGWAIALGSAVTAGIAGLMAGFLVSVVTMLLTANSQQGVLGIHHYTLAPEGLHERTDSNETKQTWQSVHSIRKRRSCLMFQIGPCLFHLLPRRDFPNEAAFDAFYEHALAKKRAA